jgi:2-polyprenyl-3-methyl-5-hydroxy-6-metoxy-1,4-benzoquinol methylase/uncharacterized protein YbaR (Trm112 family)
VTRVEGNLLESLAMTAASLACPICRSRLTLDREDRLSCERNHTYPVCEGVPVLLRADIEPTIELAKASLARARGDTAVIDRRAPQLFLESLGISDEEKEIAVTASRRNGPVDPVASVIIAAASGLGYKHLIGALDHYPIPQIPLAEGNGKILLDIGCNWGRWSIAAARKGYRVVGIDPSLGAVMAAKRIAQRLGLRIDYMVADARYLPFDDNDFDVVFSYSVVQHFSVADATQTISEIGRTLKPQGSCLIQMANAVGVRSLYNQARRRFRPARAFEVRYWRLPDLQRVFEKYIGPTTIRPHCYFGLGLERSDVDLLTGKGKILVHASDWLRGSSKILPWLNRVADSVYVASVKQPVATPTH